MLLGAIAPVALAGDPPVKPPPSEDCKMFYLKAIHGINGERLGLPRELPVDVYVNGKKAFAFEYKDQVDAELPAGEYLIEVRPAGADSGSDPIMSLGPVDIPGCYKVVVKAGLDDGKPALKVVRFKEITRK
jgi:hypothetical protein